MRIIRNSWKPERKRIVIFGAGKIGRSFIGQLFGRARYEVVFIDTDPVLVHALNRRRSYPVIIKGKRDRALIIRRVRACLATDKTLVADEIAGAAILAVSVGKNALEQVIPLIAAGLIKRHEAYPSIPLDIIIAENMRSAARFMHERLACLLPTNYPMDQLVGLVETSIGKMVPLITKEDLQKDPLTLFAEEYNELILDRKGFKGGIPDVKGLCPKENIRAWVDRKAFIHNLGHTSIAYYGAFKHKNAKYIYEVLEDTEVYRFAYAVMMQAARLLHAFYPDEYSLLELESHISDLLIRFQNRALGDTIFRVGQDLTRKLGPDDRFMGIIRMAETKGMLHDRITEAMTYGFFFNGKDDEGNMFPADVEFHHRLSIGLDTVLHEVCRCHSPQDNAIIAEIRRYYERSVSNISEKNYIDKTQLKSNKI